MKICVYTAIAGEKNLLTTPETVYPDVSYIAFVDRPYDCDVWEQRELIDFSLDVRFRNRRNAKIYKINPELFLPEHDVSVWIDPTHELFSHPREFIERHALLESTDIAVFRHSARSCVYDEGEFVKTVGWKEHEHLLDMQLENYRDSGFPRGFGLFELMVIIRRNCQSTWRFNRCWWEQICKYSSRDQLSFPFVAWSLDAKVGVAPGFLTSPDNEFARYVRRHLLMKL